MRFIIPASLMAVFLFAAGGHRIVKKFPVPGDGGWDYITVDSVAHRLYVSHATQTQVLDTESGAMVGAIPGKGVHGTTLAPKAGHGFITNGGSASVTAFDIAPVTFASGTGWYVPFWLSKP